MKRTAFKATLWNVADLVSEATAYAHNSGVRASEGLVRAYAREHGVIMHGSKPVRHEPSEFSEGGYTRIWRSADGSKELITCVSKA